MNTSGKTDWGRLDSMEDNDIDYSDIPVSDNEFWDDAKVKKHANKVDVTLSLDEDIVLWLEQFKEYEQTVNLILRNYFDTYKKIESK